MTTYCTECAHIYRANKSDPPYRFMCVKHKRDESEMGFVTRDMWDSVPPYLFCKDVNHGKCPLYEEAQPGQMKLIGDEHG